MALPSTSWNQETRAVIIHSLSSEGFTGAKISSLEAQFHVNDPCLDIPTLVGLPLWMRQHSWAGPHLDELKPASDTENEIARQLCVNATAESRNFLTAPSLKGDRLVARRDGKDLWTQHLVCLGAFCDAVVREFLLQQSESLSKENGESGLRRSDRNARGEVEMGPIERGLRFRSLATRAEFQKYWERWCRRKFGTTGKEAWRGMKGPYDM
ncbi:MAG: hypothetical protein ASARMPREDX12_000760 [Alectoria sarmentosa]|nr:MAG: hypothetical protein ASARMPREDX12_000760 [Alectoria sarmentosa]